MAARPRHVPAAAAAMDRYAVIGHPVSHSLSPLIHARFAQATGHALAYEALLAPLDAFVATARAFFEAGGRGANVTLPFKEEAFAMAAEASERARLAGAANVLAMRDGVLACDNTDGVGLVADLTRNLGIALRGARILLLGAGGATRGVVAPLLALAPARLVIANRTVERAAGLAARFAALGPVEAASLARIPEDAYGLVINATSASTRGEALGLRTGVLGPGTFAYDMAYGANARPFLAAAAAQGARVADGLGMLVEQAAESFLVWRGVRPSTAAVLAELRARCA